MPVSLVKSTWADGDLVFSDSSGTEIARFDASEAKLKITGIDLTALTNGAPGAGISGGTGTVFKSSVVRVGDIIKTTLMIDLTGLSSSTTDLDIIGTGSSAAYLGQITAAKNGTILCGRMTCLEVPAGGVDDIDLYSATAGTGVFDGGIAALVETALLTSGGAWTLGSSVPLGAMPAANEYLYLTGGAGGTAAAYTAGKFLIEFEGYAA